MRHDAFLETDRLRLVPLAPEHADGLFQAYGDPEATRFWHTPPHRTASDTQALIRDMLAGRDRSWAVIPNDEASAAGHVHYLGNDGPPGMGYILRRSHWGRGLMGEAVGAALAYGFGEVGLDRVELWIHAANGRSRKLAGRAGFRRQGAFPQKGRDGLVHETEVYGLRRSDWQGVVESAQPIRSYGLRPVLAVADVAATARWYRDRLGFRITFMVGDPANYAGVGMGDWTNTGAHIHFERTEKAASAAGFSIYLVVGAGIDRLFESYRAQGVEVVETPTDRPWGGRVFSIRDCNGYTLTFSTMS